jgi:hypothetical protein
MLHRPGLLRMAAVLSKHQPPHHLVLVAGQGSDRRRTGGGEGLLWAAPLPVAVAAAAAGEEEDGPVQGVEGRNLPAGYNWERAENTRGVARWFVRPTVEKAAAANKKPIQIRSASQLLLLHKSGCFTDLRPEHFPNTKVVVQQMPERQQVEQVEVVEVEQVVDVGEVSGASGTAVEETKKRVGDARKRKELEEKRARLETYSQQFDQRLVGNV